MCVTFTGVSWAQREVTMQQGPLYRTVGSHITIWCGVSGYQGPSQQNFLWSIYLPSAPEQEVQIVSTKDPGFSYAIYSQRVSSGNIYVERVTGDHALLHISQLEERDAGEYECHTPNTDPTYHGSYSAKMYLSVIPDTLKVTMASQELRKTQGDNMELTCNVSKVSAQHTHVSVTWLYREGTQILTLSRDFVLQPGPKYAERFSRGDIRLDKLEDTMYKLSMRGLQDTDQGDVICQASEWIQDPDGIWTAITTKQSDTTNVIVSAVSGQDFDVDINVPKVPITPGSPLELSCSISLSNPDGKAFQVTWLLNNAILGIWYPSGISRFNKQHRTLKVPEQVVIGRSSLVTWYLRINQAQPEDAGHYVCEVLEDKGLLGTTKKKRSSSVPVTVTQTELKVRLSADVSQVYEGDSVSLLCEATSFTGSVSLIWYKLGSLGQRMEMASIQREGELTLRDGYNQHLQANKLAQGSFSVKISRMTGTARYGCQVTSWLQEVYGSWRNVTTHSSDIEISVISLGSSLTTTLSIRNPKVVIGDSVRLICKASASYRLAHRTLFWTWYFLPHSDSTGSYRQMVHMSQNGSMSWGEKVPIFQGNSQLQVSENTTELRIYRVQKMQAGSFSCTIGIIDKETGDLQASSSSNKVMIQVRVPDSKLMVDTTARDMEVSIGQDQITIPCNILTMTPGSVPSITWFIHKSPATSKLEILNVSRDGMVAHSSAFWPPSHMSRFHSEKNLWNSYLLHILRPDPSLTGSFHCAVQEWLQEEGGKWTQLGEKNSGVTTVAFRLSVLTIVSAVPSSAITWRLLTALSASQG
ncbi:immunoglobulin superfamily member 3 [Bombina bombina]|uniref:immunoglobulin superfamily member 3 n=1 Tax=Bombina bombina TaxID=8345 RepID=UPI00235A90D0|nr:immunoglobulin superfamily member 3 [Bombina bombina]